MQIYRNLKPGDNGTKKLLKRYGRRLVCVRYRFDIENQKRYKTIELIVDEWVDKEPPEKEPQTSGSEQKKMFWFRFCAYLPILYREIRDAGGKRGREQDVWGLPWAKAEELGLLEDPRVENVHM